MDQIIELLKSHTGLWGNIYVMGSFANAVGGKVTQVFEQYVELEQEEGFFAYIPLDRIVYITIQKQAK